MADTKYDLDNPDPPKLNSSDYQPIFLSVMIADGTKVPKNPFFEVSSGKTLGHDHLTPVGENMMYNLGTAFLSKYRYLFRDPSNDKKAIIPGNIYKAWSDSNPSS